ncbi:MAG TPA: radical SAM protein [Ruminococcus sp.]|nr:radical SAM protein [Ruminococcus sp.]HCR73800.1 radical SAM protein [Ruminococcus sp.]
MAHKNISVFIPHAGCPNMCSFCNQNKISGAEKAPSADEVYSICRNQFENMPDRSNTEIAFFGGSFTAIPYDYMISLLECVQPFICENGFDGIRISTRPDCIDENILDILEKYHVKAIELGCQSMCDDVLMMNNRGHNSECVFKSSELIKNHGFELGLQMMTGLYGSSYEKDIETAEKICHIKPDTVRIYPTVILKNTELDRLYQSGKYITHDIEYMVNLCSEIMDMFNKNGINIIKCGLHASETVEEDMTGGYYHPAFRELCESRIFRKAFENAFLSYDEKSFLIYVSDRNISRAAGHKRSNTDYFRGLGISLKIKSDSALADDEFAVYNAAKGETDVFKIS